MRTLTKTEKKVLNLLNKIDLLSKSEDFNATIFGQAGYSVYLLLKPTPEQLNTEANKESILKDRIAWKSTNLIGDGGDADFI